MFVKIHSYCSIRTADFNSISRYVTRIVNYYKSFSLDIEKHVYVNDTTFSSVSRAVPSLSDLRA